MKGEQVNHLQMYEAVPFTVPPKIILFNTEWSNPQKYRSVKKVPKINCYIYYSGRNVEPQKVAT